MNFIVNIYINIGFYWGVCCVNFFWKYVLFVMCLILWDFMVVLLLSFLLFDVYVDGSVGLWWKRWLGCLEWMFIGMNIIVVKRKWVLLLYYVGIDVDEIFDILLNIGEDGDYDMVVVKFNEYFFL